MIIDPVAMGRLTTIWSEVAVYKFCNRILRYNSLQVKQRTWSIQTYCDKRMLNCVRIPAHEICIGAMGVTIIKKQKKLHCFCHIRSVEMF